MAKTKEKVTLRNRLRGNGKPKVKDALPREVDIVIPKLEQGEVTLRLKGDRPLLVNNKLSVAKAISDMYSGQGKTGKIKPPPLSNDEQYANAFYEMLSSKFKAPSPKGKYGVPASGIKKCGDKAIRSTGITDNTTIGLISKSYFVLEDEAGLVHLHFDRLERDERAVNIGSGQKTVPQIRHRPAFYDWYVDVRIKFNSRVLSPEQLVNLYMHAGQYIGLCEMRAEKKQGACGGFVVEIA